MSSERLVFFSTAWEISSLRRPQSASCLESSIFFGRKWCFFSVKLCLNTFVLHKKSKWNIPFGSDSLSKTQPHSWLHWLAFLIDQGVSRWKPHAKWHRSGQGPCESTRIYWEVHNCQQIGRWVEVKENSDEMSDMVCSETFFEWHNPVM